MEPETENAATEGTTTTDVASKPDDEKGLGTRSEIEILGACKRRIRATVPSEKVREQLDHNYRDLASTVQLPGFRRGRVPRKMLEKRFGDDIRSEVQETLLQESFEEVVREQNLRTFGTPRFDNIRFEDGDELSYEVELEVEPDFDLPEWSDIEVELEKPSVEDAEVDAELEDLRRHSAETVAVELPPATEPGGFDPDWVVRGDYELWVDDARAKVKGPIGFRPSSEEIDGIPVANLQERLNTWTRAEGPLRFDVTLPLDYEDEMLRGRSLELRVVARDARRLELPELDDEFASKLGFENIAKLREKIRERIEERHRVAAERKAEETIVTQLVDRAEMDLPEDFIDRFRDRRAAVRAANGGAESAAESESESEVSGEAAGTPEPAAPTEAEAAAGTESEPPPSPGETEATAPAGESKSGAENVSDEEALARFRRELKEYFVLERIADKEKIFATEDDVRNRVALLSAAYGTSPVSLLDELRATGRIGEIRTGIRHEKVRRFLREHARVISSSTAAPSEPAGASSVETGVTESEGGNPSRATSEPSANDEASAAGGSSAS